MPHVPPSDPPRPVLAVLLACLALPALARPPPEGPSGWTNKVPVQATQELVVAANPLAVLAGTEILALGGSALDAAVAAQLVLGLVEPQSSGLGGGAFLVIYQAATGQVLTYDGRETTPARVTQDHFLDAGGQPLPFLEAVIGGRAVGVPGTLRALEQAHREQGKLPWARLFAPALRLAERGFILSPRLRAALLKAQDELRGPRGAGAYLYGADGQPKAVGTRLVNPDYAASLRALAADGADALYQGPIATDIVTKIKTHPGNPGRMELADLVHYQAKKRPPLCGTYRARWRLCGMGPPAGTATVLMTLTLLEPFDLASLAPNSLAAVHLISEAERLAYADRDQYLADPDQVCVPLAGLLDGAYLRARGARINPGRSLGTPQPGDPPSPCPAPLSPQGGDREGGTTHVSILDKNGNAVALTSSVESAFGSHQWVRGFVLNNQLTDFAFAPTRDGVPVANRIGPGKRPRSAMSPLLVFDQAQGGRLHAVLGSPGGRHIPQYLVKTLVGILDWGLDPQTAINLGHFGAEATPLTRLERGSPLEALAPGLEALGHQIRLQDLNSGLHLIVRAAEAEPGKPSGGWVGAADPRREGMAAGR